MTARIPAAGLLSRTRRASAATRARTRWPLAVLRTSRPQQWAKNLLVFAAPLAAASFGRGEGLGYGLAAAAVFCSASVAVYLINDVVDADRDRRHPVKRHRPVASGELPKSHAVALAAAAAATAAGTSLSVGEPLLAVTAGGYLALALVYSLVLKHVPVIELIFVASGFVLRVLGGAVATHVPPSGWFLLVCSLGALLVATAKRFAELTVLGPAAARHRPSMRYYSPAVLRAGQRCIAMAVIAGYLLWAASETTAWARGWHLASTLPLAGALARFGWLTARKTTTPVEDLITRDTAMLCLELSWLLMFLAGL